MPTTINKTNEFVLNKGQLDSLQSQGKLIAGATYHITDYAIASNGEEVSSVLPTASAGQAGQYIKINNDRNGYDFGSVVDTFTSGSKDMVQNKTITQELKEKDEEIQKLKFEVADLENIIYDTEIKDLPYTFTNLDVANIPQYISDTQGDHKTFDGSEMLVTEIKGKTVEVTIGGVAELKSTFYKSLQVNGADGQKVSDIAVLSEAVELRSAGTIADTIETRQKDNGAWQLVKVQRVDEDSLEGLVIPIETVLVDNLAEFEVADITQKNGSIQVIGNTNSDYVRLDVSTEIQVERVIQY